MFGQEPFGEIRIPRQGCFHQQRVMGKAKRRLVGGADGAVAVVHHLLAHVGRTQHVAMVSAQLGRDLGREQRQPGCLGASQKCGVEGVMPGFPEMDLGQTRVRGRGWRGGKTVMRRDHGRRPVVVTLGNRPRQKTRLQRQACLLQILEAFGRYTGDAETAVWRQDDKPLGNLGQTQLVACDLLKPESVARALHGADAAINLVGNLKGDFDAVHHQGAANVAQAAAQAGCRSLVHVSAIGADPHSTSAYGRSKGDGEAAAAEV